MSPKAPLEKRIKRHVVGRIRTYFVITAPGFESVCSKELKALKLPLETASIIPGGIEFRGRLVDCYRANLHLRTASRILLRIKQFKATNFKQFQIKIAQIPWELYLPSNSLPRINVSVHHCRLYHSSAIGERILNCISSSGLQISPATNLVRSSKQTIYIRGVADHFTVSIDSSGNHLHKRGLKRHPGRAPLRETFAAAALMLAGYHGQKPLIDPMCGTGTFSLEAAMIARELPAGGLREFAFMGWPSFRPAQWENLKQQANTYSSGNSPPIFASDKDSIECNRLKNCLSQYSLFGNIKLSQTDFFNIDPRDLTDRAGLVVINPPYGRRLENRLKGEALFMNICSQLKRKFKGWQIILISPTRRLAQKVPFELSSHPFSHGGLKPVMMIGTIT